MFLLSCPFLLQVNMLAQRYDLTQQRILRHSLFRPNSLSSQSSSHAKLTPIESLLGKKRASSNQHARQHLLLGLLTQLDEGHYYLEDPTGRVRVSFAHATAVDGFFVTEQCLLLVEASFRDDVLYVHRVGGPLLEQRQTTLSALQQQVSHPHFELRTTSETAYEDPAPSFVLLSDLRIDQPAVVQRLEGLLASYEAQDSLEDLPLFVLMGSFAATPEDAPEAVAELIATLAKFPLLSQHAHFVIVPGSHDTQAGVVPYSPISKGKISNRLANKVANFHLASNPCRINWGRQGRRREMVVFCYDLLQLFLQHHLTIQTTSNKTHIESRMEEGVNDHTNGDDRPHVRLVKTILDQGHLVPMPTVPKFWNYDHALRLYPLPDALVLGGDPVLLSRGMDEVYGDCQVVHPGSMTQHQYAVYRPIDDMLAMNDDVDEPPSRVEFHRTECASGESFAMQ